jgi:hypothetical protein
MSMFFPMYRLLPFFRVAKWLASVSIAAAALEPAPFRIVPCLPSFGRKKESLRHLLAQISHYFSQTENRFYSPAWLRPFSRLNVKFGRRNFPAA